MSLAWALPALVSATTLAAPCAAPDNLNRVTGGSECLLIKTFGNAAGAKTLFVLLHGNHTSGSPAVSHFKLADALVKQGPPATVAVALIRPGYNNGEGKYSSGKDDVTPPALSVAYTEALRARGIAVELSILPDVEHVAVIGSPVVVREALRLGEQR